MIQPPHFFEEAAEGIEHERQWYRERILERAPITRNVSLAKDPHRLPLARRAFSDRRTLTLTVATLVAAVVVFGAAKLWFPLLDKVFEWFFAAFAALLVLGEVAVLVHNFRRRRRWHPPVPKPLAALTRDERLAAQLISEIVLDFPAEVAEGRAKGDLSDRMRPHIDFACAQFFLLAGETPETFAAFQTQLARILAGGESRLIQDYLPPERRPAEAP